MRDLWTLAQHIHQIVHSLPVRWFLINLRAFDRDSTKVRASRNQAGEGWEGFTGAVCDKVDLDEVGTVGGVEGGEELWGTTGKCTDVMGVPKETMSAFVTEKVMSIVPDIVFVG